MGLTERVAQITAPVSLAQQRRAKAKAITLLVVLRDAMIHNMCDDDRPPSLGVDFIDTLNKQAATVIEKYKKANPKHYTIKDKARGGKA